MKPAQDNQSLFDMALAAYQEDRLNDARELLTHLLSSPGLSKKLRFNTHMLMGHTQFESKDLDDALHQYNKCLKIQANYAVYERLAAVYDDLKLYQKAIHCCKEALKLKPHDIDVYLGMASTYKNLYEYDNAIQCYRAIIAQDPNHALAYRNLSSCIQYDSIDHDDRKAIDDILKQPDLDESDASQCYFALGKIYSDVKDYTTAFQYFDMGNKIRAQTHPFDLEKHEKRLATTLMTFSKDFVEPLKPLGNPSTQPIFILGLTRSGKTLIERIICQNPDVCAKEEIAILNKQVNKYIPRNDFDHYEQNCYEFLNDDGIDILSKEYLRQLQRDAKSNITHFTDTTPCNYRFLGFIRVLFPNAKVIFVKRHPLDQCLQIYFKYYSKGHHFTYDLKKLGRYYALYLDMMESWQHLFGEDMLTIQYEHLIEDPISTQEAIFEYLEMPCPDLSQSDLTISSDEVNLWQKYEKQFKPLIKILKPYLN